MIRFGGHLKVFRMGPLLVFENAIKVYIRVLKYIFCKQ